MQILVVDDDRIFCQLLAELLASRGHEVDWASRALEAFKLAQRNYYELFMIERAHAEDSRYQVGRRTEGTIPRRQDNFDFRFCGSFTRRASGQAGHTAPR